MSAFFTDLLHILQNPYVALIFFTALVFDFINGFHDAANSIATIVGTRVLRPFTAVLWAAWWNFAASAISAVVGFHVADTVAKWIAPGLVTPDVIFAGLLGAIVWNLLTWTYGLPSSSSHALLGGLAGAAMMSVRHWHGVLHDPAKVLQTVEYIAIAPLLGLVLGLLFLLMVMWTCRRIPPAKVDRSFRVIQLGSAAAFSLGHGMNDAQKTMGVIAALLYRTIWADQHAALQAGHFPFWIALACFFAIGFGTLTGGWRIVKTMGLRITKLRPYDGACAELAAATSLFASAAMGVPVSTTHTITGAIIGVGAVHRLSAVRWGVARQVVWAWVLTIPCSAVVAAGVYWTLRLVTHP
jgi:PiT family inorganic phosphate transporter